MGWIQTVAKRVHKVTAYVLVIFALLHIVNHLAIFLGAKAHIDWMEKLCAIYHQPILWRVLLYSVIFQIVSGFLNLRWRNFRSPNKVVRLQAFSGAYLMLFLLNHIAAIHYARFIQDIETNLYFATIGFRSLPAALFFYPYYFFAVLGLFVHLACAWKNIASRKHWKNGALVYGGMIAIGFVVAFLLILGLSGIAVKFETPANG